MSPEDVARLFPRLFHVTEPGASLNVQRFGLLCTLDALRFLEVEPDRIMELTRNRRPKPVSIDHPEHGSWVINDNIPLSENALKKCLDDGLAPADWLEILNGMVFFWPDENGVRSHLSAKANRTRPREVLVFDTRSLIDAHHQCARLSPINSGSTIRKAARRGLRTFSAVPDYSYAAWKKLRGGSDRVKEIAVVGSVRDAMDHLADVRDGRSFF